MNMNIYNKLPLYRTTVSANLFLTNIAHASKKNDPYYMYSFMGLYAASVLYHQSIKFSRFHKIIGYVDKLCILNVVCYGGTKLIQYSKFDAYSSTVAITFLGVNWLYGYGSLTNKYIFDKCADTGNNYHMLLHALTCFGHHIIIFTVS